MSSRGIRNNNPANIRRGSNWIGLVSKPTDKEFCQFVSMTFGIRALLITLRTYVVKHDLHSVEQIISRWAPPQDGNDTKRYIEFVEQAVGEIDAPTSMSLRAMDFKSEHQHPQCILYLISRAMCEMESGYDLEYEIYLNAIRLM